MRRLRVPADLVALIRGLHPQIKRKVRAGLDEILDDPTVGKALREELAALRSYRLGRLRIVYRIGARGIVEIVNLGPRETIYQETLRLLRKERTKSSRFL